MLLNIEACLAQYFINHIITGKCRYITVNQERTVRASKRINKQYASIRWSIKTASAVASVNLCEPSVSTSLSILRNPHRDETILP